MWGTQQCFSFFIEADCWMSEQCWMSMTPNNIKLEVKTLISFISCHPTIFAYKLKYWIHFRCCHPAILTCKNLPLYTSPSQHSSFDDHRNTFITVLYYLLKSLFGCFKIAFHQISGNCFLRKPDDEGNQHINCFDMHEHFRHFHFFPLWPLPPSPNLTWIFFKYLWSFKGKKFECLRMDKNHFKDV